MTEAEMRRQFCALRGIDPQTPHEARAFCGGASDAATCVQERFDLAFLRGDPLRCGSGRAPAQHPPRPEGGRRVHSVRHHPVYSALYPVRRERACIQPWIECNDRVENRLSTCFHHAFTDYANAVAAAGLAIDEAREPLPPQRRKEASPERCDRFVETPCVLILKLSAR